MGTSTLFTAFAICACLMGTNSKESSNDTLSSPQAVVDEWMAKQPGGAVAATLVSENNTQVFYAGNLLPNSSSVPNEHTMFEIGSVTKGFTGLLLADQVLCGNVSLNDTLKMLLTDWPGRTSSAAGSVTLLQLATHSSGLPRLPANMDEAYIVKNLANPYAPYNKELLYAWLDTVKNLTSGTYAYSNAGLAILGHALAVVNEKSFEELLKERVLIPLGLKDTTITLDGNQTNRLAPGHNGNGQLNSNWDFDVLAPCGALRSSIADMQHMLKVATGLIQSDDSVQAIIELATRKWGNISVGKYAIGLGWHRLQLPNKLVIWHNGATGGCSAFLGWCNEQKIGVAILDSVTLIPNNTIDALGLALLDTITVS